MGNETPEWYKDFIIKQETYYKEMEELHKDILGSTLIKFIEIERRIDYCFLFYFNLSLVRVEPFFQYFLNKTSFGRKKDIISNIIKNDKTLKKEFKKLIPLLERISKFRNKLAHREIESIPFDSQALRNGKGPEGFFLSGSGFSGKEPLTKKQFDIFISEADEAKNLILNLDDRLQELMKRDLTTYKGEGEGEYWGGFRNERN